MSSIGLGLRVSGCHASGALGDMVKRCRGSGEAYEYLRLDEAFRE